MDSRTTSSDSMPSTVMPYSVSMPKTRFIAAQGSARRSGVQVETRESGLANRPVANADGQRAQHAAVDRAPRDLHADAGSERVVGFQQGERFLAEIPREEAT